MAERRMFSKRVTDSDAFIEMPSATQALYFHLNQAADDDGFNNQIQVAMMKSHASADDLKILLMKRFIIRFESGVIVIKHWRMHNTLRKDRYTPTSFQEEFSRLGIKENQSYALLHEPDGCQVVANPVPQVSIGKVSEVKESKEKNNNTCSQQSEYCTELTADVEAVILNTGQEWRPAVEQYKEFKRLYPNVDIDAEFRNMRAWCIANPSKRKTAKGVTRFINSWLARTQDRPKKGVEHNTQLDQWANA